MAPARPQKRLHRVTLKPASSGTEWLTAIGLQGSPTVSSTKPLTQHRLILILRAVILSDSYSTVWPVLCSTIILFKTRTLARLWLKMSATESLAVVMGVA